MRAEEGFRPSLGPHYLSLKTPQKASTGVSEPVLRPINLDLALAAPPLATTLLRHKRQCAILKPQHGIKAFTIEWMGSPAMFNSSIG